MRVVLAMVTAVMVVLPGIALAEPPVVQTVVVNGSDRAIPVQGAVTVAETPLDVAATYFDKSVQCIGNGPSFQCDASFNGPVLLERVSAHCNVPVSGFGHVQTVKVVTSVTPTAPSVPADGLKVVGPIGGSAVAYEGGRRFLPLTDVFSANPASAMNTTASAPVSLSAVVPGDRLVRLAFEGDMSSATCFVVLSGRWLR
jgi:hypothetical protein